MTNQMTHTEANILAENGFTVDASLKYATAKFNSGRTTYTVSVTGLHSPWRITCKNYQLQPSIYNFKTFYDVMEFLWTAHREKAFPAIV